MTTFFTATARQTLTIVRTGASPGDDDYGNPLPGTKDTFDIRGCVFQPLVLSPSTEQVDFSADQIVTRWRGFAPPDADIQATDHILYQGAEYAVDGDPVVWSRPSGKAHHTEFYAKKWEG